jgi:preprotein translocase subunit YajC
VVHRPQGWIVYGPSALLKVSLRQSRATWLTTGPPATIPGAAAVSSPLLNNELLLAQNVQPKAGTPGVAAEGAPAPSGQAPGSPLAGFMPILMMLVIFVPFFLLMSRRQKKERQARESLKKGDRVMTNAGLVGELMEMDERLAKVKIAPGVTVQIVANTVTPFVDPVGDKAGSKELKEAKAVSDKK